MNKFLSLILCLLLISCAENSDSNLINTDFIPDSAEVIFVSPSSEQLEKDLLEHEATFNSGDLKDLTNESKDLLKYIKSEKQSILYLNGDSIGSKHIVLIIQKDSTSLILDSIQNKQVETFKEDIEYQKVKLEKSEFYQRDIANFSILSESKHAIVQAKRSNKSNSQEFQKALDASDPRKTSFIYSNMNVMFFSKMFSEIDLPKKNGNWKVLELHANSSQLIYNGISIHANSEASKDFAPVIDFKHEVARFCPENFITIVSMNPGLKLQSKDTTVNLDFLDKVSDISSIKLKTGNIHIWNAIDTELVKNRLFSENQLSERFREIDIFEGSFAVPELLLNSEVNLSSGYFIVIDHFIISSEEISVLKDLIINFQNGKTLLENPQYVRMMNSLASESSMLAITTISAAKDFGIAKESEFKKGSLAAFQVISEEKYDHLHGIITEPTEADRLSKGAEQIATITTSQPIAGILQFFRNHETDQMDILVEDTGNQLSLFSNKGRMFWSKQLDSQISGKVHEVDLFKNGNKQLAFSTGFQLEVLDRKGRDVKPFPKKFNDPLTQPLAVFDYDNNRKYRFVLTQNNKVYVLGPKGNSIKGFDFDGTKNTIIKAPKHIRLGNKDYILIQEESGRLQILSRQGSIRVPTTNNFNISENDWYGYQSNFITTQPESNLIEVDQNGKVNLKNLDLAENNRLVANEDHLVYLNENELTINNSSVSLDFGLYTNPQLFLIGRKIYVSITDTQAKKVYVFNENAELLPGFPVYGTSEVDLANADLDKRLEMIVKGDDNEILLYKL
ncbi:hypothetical protein [Christiangramia sp. OXR-203]|uniref:hypothetical protein n=1 Tax=Christiangramia sp. OXR-203 TaxID=3100176 RepID=UPI002AC9A1DE|nr:hypothetical protein [Christiangramia sp. OXR-203]WPY99063.1 hypothetical protein T8I65_02325 [Christiangramia sp. OXR-203]